ncbi:zinc ribbon domain-containing protein [Gracilibacillus sp. S3-1-1]|uniref:Zinc ribbon domain-containing protein n=1 Tax=Gracilibacillus pellucidus TaxID=3095368 RepID=A0ACC6M8B4_9BACI|nr:zinc ribbon domain-containing protein [Gracilibacillus sp. S3-1-1]MDX8047226.1 zinc ribbon domain-containing protein [Gracilibacillus sp. S3-1-1]
MTTCPKCGTEQEEGNFCEACGAPLQTTTEHAAADGPAPQAEAASTKASETFEKVKAESEQYWNYFLTRLKKPSIALRDGEHALSGAIITSILLPLLVAIFLYVVANNMWKEQDFGFMDMGSLPFFSIVSRLFFIAVLFFFTGLLANFITLKITKNTISVKTLYIRYAGLLVPFVAIFAVFTLLALVGVISINLNYPEDTLLMFSLFVILLSTAIYINPIIHAFYHLQQHKQNYYFTLLTLLFNIIIIVILVRMFVSEMIDSLENLL